MEKEIKNNEDKVWVTLERTINLGNYESVKVIVGQSRTIKPKEVPEELIETISDTLFDILVERGKEYKRVLTKTKRTL